ncbi:hypothetical protein [Larkinella harenae]
MQSPGSNRELSERPVYVISGKADGFRIADLRDSPGGSSGRVVGNNRAKGYRH